MLRDGTLHISVYSCSDQPSERQADCLYANSSNPNFVSDN